MAINSSHVIRNKIESKESCGALSQNSNEQSHVMTLTITTTQSSINSDKRCRVTRTKGLTSPYLAGDKVKLSRLKEKKVIHKQPFDPSFPLATNVYKANSDEFRTPKRNNKKVKKSVLTLPNESSTDGIVGTVSDVNDVTEYNKDQRNREHKIKIKKRLPIERKSRVRNKNLYYDRDARYELDCSSTDIIKHYKGDGMTVSRKKTIAKVSETESKLDPHDVWAVLRNINRFQFTPSPPMSDYSNQSHKKKRGNKKRPRKDTRVIETTCHTEEFAYISSFTPTSSIDRITVIDKQNEFTEFYKEFEDNFSKCTNIKDSKNLKVFNKKRTPRNNNINTQKNKDVAKSVKSNGKQRESCNQSLTLNDKVIISNTPKQLPVTDKGTVDEKAVNAAADYHDAAEPSSETDDKIKSHDLRTDLKLSYETICTVNSGSSKAGLHDFVNKKKTVKSKLVHSDESNQQMKGITKVAVISKAPDCVVSKRSSTPMRKPRLATTMPTSAPKLTQTEIKRRLNSMKFPMVVLEKDELGCSSIEVPYFEPIQFRGLSDHVWPFMKDWDDGKDESLHRNNINRDTGDCIQQYKGKQNTTKSSKNNVHENKPVTFKDNKVYTSNMKKTDSMRQNIVQDSKHVIPQPMPKPRPMKQLKDKMIKLLYKKSVEEFTLTNGPINGKKYNMTRRPEQNFNTEKQTIKSKNTGTDAVKSSSYQPIPVNIYQDAIESPKKEDTKQISTSIARHPWARGKWASDFIESVIKKIKSGIYYNQENKIFCKKCCKDSKEASIQTALTVKSEDNLNKIIEITNKSKSTSEYKTIPGFDSVLAPVEIKTLNTKQITVKHCSANVLLQFDVCIPTNKKLKSFESPKYIDTPFTSTECNTKIIKCETSIINSIMPAELCSIIPKMIKNISDFNTNFQVTFPAILPRKQEFPLATITELTQNHSVDSLKYSFTSLSFISGHLKSFLRGNYGLVFNIKCKRISSKRINVILNPKDVKDITIHIEIFPLLCYRHIFYEDAIEATARNMNALFTKQILSRDKGSSCMALQPYIAPKQYIPPTFDICNVTKLLQHLCFRNVIVNFDFPKYFPLSVSDIKITVCKKSCPKYVQEVSVTHNLKVDSIFNGFLKSNKYKSEPSCFENTVKCIEYNKQSSNSQDKKQKNTQNMCHVKTKKKCFVKLYRKCKSTSNIASEKTTTALSKITNLDHFLQALGSGKLLSSVFDGYSEKKIMSSISEMKNWITDISQRQAMLILLLTNKKDTPNLIRYRPIILQGIAVNRITRASELDMEIEVIETENLYKLPHYEEISYVTASTQNNNLLEELYWIAKTTASDYQKPFDESSERLLKSLTEKRKMLNPSYLRVMARYVGLGLLKHPKK